MQTRDIIVVGASMGGVEALTALMAQLPAGLAAAMLVVQHTAPESPGVLAEILDRVCALPVVLAADGMPAERGRVYVAPPDRHLLLTARGIGVVYGPRENRVRPAIDPLFRTAAVNFRGRVIGVVLTGTLGDGAAGLYAVNRCGGAAVVQALDDAEYPDMPRRALASVPTALQAPLAELGSCLVRLAAEPAPEPPPVPEGLRIEARYTERAMTHDDWGNVPSHRTDFTCPECNGAIHEIEGEPVKRFRCRIGHAYSADDLVAAKGRGVEDALWLALQTLREQAQVLESLASEDRRRGWDRNAGSYETRARAMRDAAERLRELVGKLAA